MTYFGWMREQLFFGFVADPSDLKRKFVVEILVDGCAAHLVRADQPAHQLIQDGIGDGCYGFSVSVRPEILREAASVEARLANIGALIGSPILLDLGDEAVAIGVGEAQWLGGLHFSGWVEKESDAASLRIEVDGQIVDQIRCAGWRHLGSVENARSVRSFDFHLPTRFADGLVHHLQVLTTRGQKVDVCPLSFLTYQPEAHTDEADNIRMTMRQGVDARVGRSTLKSSPFSKYRLWREKFLVDAGASLSTQIAVLMFGPGDASDTLDCLHEQTHRDWAAVSLEPNEAAMGFEPKALREFLGQEAAECEIFVCALAGSLLVPNALRRIANVFSNRRETIIAYGDFDLPGPDGSLWPVALTAFDYERMLEQGYCAYLFAMRRAVLERSLDSGAGDLYRLFNAALDVDWSPAQNIVHLPGALAILPKIDARAASAALGEAGRLHLRQRNLEVSWAEIDGAVLPAVRIRRAAAACRTTIVVVTRNRRDLLKACLASVSPATAKVKAEILVVDNDSADPECLDFLSEVERLGTRVIRAPGEFNYPDLMNRGVHAATGETLCLLDSDVIALDDTWLEEMLSRLNGPSVGAVGAMVVSSSGVVKCGGVVLGSGFAMADAFTDRLATDSGYADLLRVAHECSAVSSACLLVNRDDYLRVGGMDGVRFPIGFGDLDLCLKLREMGKRIIFTPHARLQSRASTRRAANQAVVGGAVFERELRTFRTKWGNTLSADPYYNPLLSLDSNPYSALAWPPRSLSPRVNGRPIASAVLRGF